LIEREEDSGSVKITLNLLSTGLFCPVPEVHLWCAKVLTRLGIYIDELKILGYGYSWFIEEDGGLDSILYCFERQPDSMEALVPVITTYCKYNLMEMFTQ
jgi:hypothetical protein